MAVLKAVILTEILMDKLPAIFIIYFKREGVVDAVLRSLPSTFQF